MSEEEYKKMWDNMLKKLNETERYYLAIVNNQKNQEIDRLNNIINELEKDSIAFKKLNAWIVNRHAPDLFHKMEIIDKLEELKDSDKE